MAQCGMAQCGWVMMASPMRRLVSKKSFRRETSDEHGSSITSWIRFLVFTSISLMFMISLVLPNHTFQNLFVYLHWCNYPPAIFINYNTPQIKQWPFFEAINCTQPIETITQERTELELSIKDSSNTNHIGAAFDQLLNPVWDWIWEKFLRIDDEQNNHIIRGFYIQPQINCEIQTTHKSDHTDTDTNTNNPSSDTDSHSSSSDTRGAVPSKLLVPTISCPPRPISLSPIVLYLHGNGENRAFFNSIYRYSVFTSPPLCAHVIVFDYRSFGDSDTAASLKKRRRGPTMQTTLEDGIAMYEYARKQVGSESQPQIILYGHSLGSGIAAQLLQHIHRNQLPPPIALVLEAPFVSIPAVVHSYFPFVPSSYFSHLCIEHYPTLQTLPGIVTDLEMDVLILHGNDDIIVPTQHGNAIYEAIVKERKKRVGGKESDGKQAESNKGSDFFSLLLDEKREDDGFHFSVSSSDGSVTAFLALSDVGHEHSLQRKSAVENLSHFLHHSFQRKGLLRDGK